MLYESTGIETRFTNLLDPEPRSRRTFGFHRPETLAKWAGAANPPATSGKLAAEAAGDLRRRGAASLAGRLHQLPPEVDAPGLWPAQRRGDHQPRDIAAGEPAPRPDPDGDRLRQDVHGGQRRSTGWSSSADAERVLFLVDRANLGRQTLKEFQQFATPDDGRKFTELYNVQHLHLEPDRPGRPGRASRPSSGSTRCCGARRSSTRTLDEELAVRRPSRPTRAGAGRLQPERSRSRRSTSIIIDECHRSIYGLWRQVLEYFDAFLDRADRDAGQADVRLLQPEPRDGVRPRAGRRRRRQRRLRRLPDPHRDHRAGRDGRGRDSSTKFRDRADAQDALGEARRGPRPTTPASSTATSSPRTRSAPSSATFRDRLFTEIFPGRTEVPKTLIFAKDDSHADDIVQIVPRGVRQGQRLRQKITYKHHRREARGPARRSSATATTRGSPSPST